MWAQLMKTGAVAMGNRVVLLLLLEDIFVAGGCLMCFMISMYEQREKICDGATTMDRPAGESSMYIMFPILILYA